jgi:hypothetical protein
MFHFVIVKDGIHMRLHVIPHNRLGNALATEA